jgi:hypothetical protein
MREVDRHDDPATSSGRGRRRVCIGLCFSTACGMGRLSSCRMTRSRARAVRLLRQSEGYGPGVCRSASCDQHRRGSANRTLVLVSGGASHGW